MAGKSKRVPDGYDPSGKVLKGGGGVFVFHVDLSMSGLFLIVGVWTVR